MGTSDQQPNINTGGGAFFDGNVSVRGNFAGRDQFNFGIMLGGVNNTASAVSALAELMRSRTKDDLMNAGIIASLTELMEELRKTHATIVRLISPFRRIEEDSAEFSRDFKAYYSTFREFVDTHDFIDERTHCSKISQIKARLRMRGSSLEGTTEWQTLQSHLEDLTSFDTDIIEGHYVPFVKSLDSAMKSIYDLVDHGQIKDAIAKKRELLAVLQPEFEKTKEMLCTMNDTINTLVLRL